MSEIGGRAECVQLRPTRSGGLQTLFPFAEVRHFES